MIGYLALARDTFDINYALDNKKRFEKFMYNTGKLRNNPVNIKLNAFFSSYLLNKKYKTIGTLNKPT